LAEKNGAGQWFLMMRYSIDSIDDSATTASRRTQGSARLQGFGHL